MLLLAIIFFIFGAAVYKSCGEYYFRFIRSILNMSDTEELSDDEIFFGKLTLKEIKKRLQWNGPNTFGESKSNHKVKTDPDASIKIIETHSEPNLRSVKEKVKYLSTPGSPKVKSPSEDSFMSNVKSQSEDNFMLNVKSPSENNFMLNVKSPSEDNFMLNVKSPSEDNFMLNVKSPSEDNFMLNVKSPSEDNFMLNVKSPPDDSFTVNVTSPSDGSFLQIETMVSDLCVSPRTSDNVELNNTLEVIEYILKNAPKHDNIPDTVAKGKLNEVDDVKKSNLQLNESLENVKPKLNKSPKIEKIESKEQKMLEISPEKEKLEIYDHNDETDTKECIEYFTPIKLATNPDIYVTSSSGSVQKTLEFKTPAPLSNKKTGSSVKKTPNRTNAYQHIASPIAAYIKNCPQVPLVKVVHPKKPLPGSSSIPKLIKSQPTKSQNKENIVLPQVAYKSAKKTKVINIDSERMPQSQWAKKITSTLPRPTVMKHMNREINPLKIKLHPKHEDSFDDLSCMQAEVSVCTKKSAFKRN